MPVSYRKILHLDLDAFFCAVEEQRDPSLRGKAFAVGGRPDQRGVISSCSYAARRFGIHSAQPTSQAMRLCPHLILVSPHFSDYREASQRVMAVLHDLTPFVEQISIDEAFLDVAMLRDTGETIARTLQARIRDELGLPCSLGVATNKLVAKVATNMGKARAQRDESPNAILVIPPGHEAAFLAPLPVRELWGVGPKTAEQLNRLGIQTIGDIARWPEADLAKRFGKNGAELSLRARGQDDRPVESEGETKSVSKETTFVKDIRDAVTLKRTLQHLADEVGHRLRQENLAGTTIKIKLRWADFTTLTRQITLAQATNHDQEIYEAAVELFTRTWIVGRPVRLIGIGVSGFEEAAQQLSLWRSTTMNEEKKRLENTLDDLRNRFGDQIIKRGSNLFEDD